MGDAMRGIRANIHIIVQCTFGPKDHSHVLRYLVQFFARNYIFMGSMDLVRKYSLTQKYFRGNFTTSSDCLFETSNDEGAFDKIRYLMSQTLANSKYEIVTILEYY